MWQWKGFQSEETAFEKNHKKRKRAVFKVLKEIEMNRNKHSRCGEALGKWQEI